MTFYISDLHFGHANVLSYDNREFPDIETHDRSLIEKWNEAVSPSDTVWILGDISWYGSKKTEEILDSLNGTKNLCVGNHDGRILKSPEVRSRFAEIVPYKEITEDSGFGIVLCHYPIPCFNNHYYEWIHLYGHVHNSFEENMMRHVAYQMKKLYDKPCNMFNVGCMMPYMNYRPRTLSDIMMFASREQEKETVANDGGL